MPTEPATPPDLCPQAVKVARRLQALRRDRMYVIVFVPTCDDWQLSVMEPEGSKVERCKANGCDS